MFQAWFGADRMGRVGPKDMRVMCNYFKVVGTTGARRKELQTAKGSMEGIVRAVGWSYESAAIWQYESAQGYSEGLKEIGT